MARMCDDYVIEKQLGTGEHTKLLNYFRRRVWATVPNERYLKIKQRTALAKQFEDLVLDAYFAGMDHVKESKNVTQKS